MCCREIHPYQHSTYGIIYAKPEKVVKHQIGNVPIQIGFSFMTKNSISEAYLIQQFYFLFCVTAIVRSACDTDVDDVVWKREYNTTRYIYDRKK